MRDGGAPRRTTRSGADGAGPAGRLRAWLLVAHRWVGLAMSAFLIVAGGTGSVLVFQHELEPVVCPALHVAPAPGAARLEPAALVAAALPQLPAGTVVTQVPLNAEAGATVALGVTAAVPGGDDQVFVDPASGRVVGSRRWGDLAQGRCNLVPFLFGLHYALALDDVGTWLMGAVALLWTVDCFVGAYLTFPGRSTRRRERRRSWLARWLPSWGLRTGKLVTLVFTWHRASGLWLWALLFVFAWSGVAMNLRPVYVAVMHALVAFEPSYDERAEPLPAAERREDDPTDWDAGLTAARRHMAEQAASRGFTIVAERRIAWDVERRAFRYQVRSTLDVSDRYPATTIWIDGADRRLLAFEAPTGRAAGNTIETWLYNLHFGTVAAGGLPYRVVVSAAGVGVVLLAGSGVWLWLRGRTRRARIGAPGAAEHDHPGSAPAEGAAPATPPSPAAASSARVGAPSARSSAG